MTNRVSKCTKGTKRLSVLLPIKLGNSLARGAVPRASLSQNMIKPLAVPGSLPILDKPLVPFVQSIFALSGKL